MNAKRTQDLYDVIVLGAGSGGLNIASFINRVGLRVLLVDRSAEAIGGDCLNYGCVPSKALIHVAREVAAARRATRFGLSVSSAVDMAAVRAYVREKQDVFRANENPDYLRSTGVTVALGAAAFVGPDTVRVGDTHYRGKHIVIATGSRPRPYTLPGAENMVIHSNETIFDIETIPDTLVLIGGGPISLEIGQAFHMLGSNVHVIQTGPEILGKEDPVVAMRLREKMSADGMIFHLNTKPVRVEKGNALVVSNNGAEEIIPFDALFAAVGRIPNIDALNLEAAHVMVKDGKIVSDAFLRTTNHRVYVCGDAVGGYQFTHAAELHASVLLRNFFAPFRQRVGYAGISWVTYTDPELATFGASEQELTKAGVNHSVIETSFTEDDRAILDEYEQGLVRLFISSKGLLLGGTMLAPNAGELVQELTLAMAQGIPLTALSEKVYPYPTAGRMNRRTALLLRAQKLSPFAKKVLRTIFSFRS
ncbi:MAG TPA: FAD-dependent oxidoreductase [Candidatus Paceibacterota bacterium]|nr:FAD-dependent oxidoreductase [Candidatus Paceibacterota bacterium]